MLDLVNMAPASELGEVAARIKKFLPEGSRLFERLAACPNLDDFIRAIRLCKKARKDFLGTRELECFTRAKKVFEKYLNDFWVENGKAGPRQGRNGFQINRRRCRKS